MWRMFGRRCGRALIACTSLLLVVAAGDPSGSRANGAAAAVDPRPNIIVIVTDDQRLAADSMMVMPKTMALFGAGGVSFPRYTVTTPLCCPSRSSIMSGRYAHNTGVLTNGDEGEVQAFDQDATAQRYLHDAGYLTAMDGKYFNTWPIAQDPPNWDHWALFGGGYWDSTFNVDGAVGHSSGYSTDVVGNHAVDFLQAFESQDDSPWFMYIAPQAPHSPYDVAPAYQDAGLPPWDPRPSFAEKDISDKPPNVQSRSYSRIEALRLRAGQLRTLMSVDDMVQRVFASARCARRIEHAGDLHVGQRVHVGGAPDRRRQALPVHRVGRGALLPPLAGSRDRGNGESATGGEHRHRPDAALRGGCQP